MEQIAVLVFEGGEASTRAESGEDRAKEPYHELEELAKIGDRKGVCDRCSNR